MAIYSDRLRVSKLLEIITQALKGDRGWTRNSLKSDIFYLSSPAPSQR